MCSTILEAGLDFAMAGTMAPAANAIVRKIGTDERKVEEWAPEMTEFLHKMFNVPLDR